MPRTGANCGPNCPVSASPLLNLTHFRIYLDGLDPQRIIESIDTPLTLLQTHSPTLEDAYLKIVGYV